MYVAKITILFIFQFDLKRKTHKFKYLLNSLPISFIIVIFTHQSDFFISFVYSNLCFYTPYFMLPPLSVTWNLINFLVTLIIYSLVQIYIFWLIQKSLVPALRSSNLIYFQFKGNKRHALLNFAARLISYAPNEWMREKIKINLKNKNTYLDD